MLVRFVPYAVVILPSTLCDFWILTEQKDSIRKSLSVRPAGTRLYMLRTDFVYLLLMGNGAATARSFTWNQLPESAFDIER